MRRSDMPTKNSLPLRFLIASNPAALQIADPDATVEAEYGDAVVSGRVLTMAHHGPRAGQRAPCAYENLPEKTRKKISVVGLSHFDLDTLGGCMAILGLKSGPPSFWKLAEFVDLNGPHKIRAFKPNKRDLEAIHAFWAWSESHRVYPPRDGSVADVTREVFNALDALDRIFVGDEALLEAGREFATREDKLSYSTIVDYLVARRIRGTEVDSPHSAHAPRFHVVIRKSKAFVNHLYTAGSEGAHHAFDAVVAFNPEVGSITLSFPNTPPKSSARALVQKLWGPLAGGHDTIAGSPRGEVFKLDDARELARLVITDVSE